MATTKTKTAPEEATALAAVDAGTILDPNSFESVLAEYGVTAGEMYVPEPPTVLKQNLDQVCELTTAVYDARGNAFADVNGHSGPLMFLAKGAEIDGDKFEGYDGFYVYDILHPIKGKLAVTIGRPEGDKKPTLVRYLDTLKPGAWFQVASMSTSKGFRVFNPIPVQRGRA